MAVKFSMYLNRRVFIMQASQSLIQVLNVAELVSEMSTEPQHEKTYFLTCAPNKDSNQPVHPDHCLRCPHEEALQP